jgi:Mg2+-importing ATPase
VFHADAPTFQTAWFLESIATQILVIFLIRSRGAFWRSRPHWILVTTSLGALAGTILMVASPLRHLFGFVSIGAPLAWTIVAIVLGYLACAEALKRFAIPRSARQQRAAR